MQARSNVGRKQPFVIVQRLFCKDQADDSRKDNIGYLSVSLVVTTTNSIRECNNDTTLGTMDSIRFFEQIR
jgi:hypothetical protein